MQVNAYVNFAGNCEAAFKFYQEVLGATPGPIFRYAGTAFADQVAPDWHDKVMHGSVTIGSQTIMGADVAGAGYQTPQGFSLSLQIKGAAEAERIFDALAADGAVRVPLEKTFWAERFGMVVDRFGVPWMINCEP